MARHQRRPHRRVYTKILVRDQPHQDTDFPIYFDKSPAEIVLFALRDEFGNGTFRNHSRRAVETFPGIEATWKVRTRRPRHRQSWMTFTATTPEGELILLMTLTPDMPFRRIR